MVDDTTVVPCGSIDETGRVLVTKTKAPEPMSKFEADATNTFAEALDLLETKHHDYGPHNVGRSPGGPMLGLAVRLHDKVARLAHLLDGARTGVVAPHHESIRDTFIDIMNYGAIGVMVHDGKWPSS